MKNYMQRLYSILKEEQDGVSPPKRGTTVTAEFVAPTVRTLADTWKTDKLKSLGYPTNADAALIASLKEEQRASQHNEGSVRVELALTALTAHAHVETLLLAGDVSLAARMAAMIDEVQYKERLLVVYEALNEL